MDVGDPSNFVRIMDLYKNSHGAISADISGASYSDEQISATMKSLLAQTGYVADPHGACGYRALEEQLKSGETGVFLETAHPSKFKESVERITGVAVEIPDRLKVFMERSKISVPMSREYSAFRSFLESRS